MEVMKIGKARNPHVINAFGEGAMVNNTYQPSSTRALPNLFVHAMLDYMNEDPFLIKMAHMLREKDPRKLYLYSGTSNNVSLITQYAGEYIEYEGKLYKIPIEYKDPQRI